MAEYIKREALKEYLYGGKFRDGCAGCDEPGEGCIERIVDEIDNFPAADVAQVRRGKWGCYKPFCDGYPCSRCKLTHRNCTAYCPNCGAKMEVDYDD